MEDSRGQGALHPHAVGTARNHYATLGDPTRNLGRYLYAPYGVLPPELPPAFRPQFLFQLGGVLVVEVDSLNSQLPLIVTDLQPPCLLCPKT
jgi:hypothetical protein